MEWAKDIIGMNYFWLIRNCSLFFCFRLSLLFAFILSLSLLYLSLCVCLIAFLFPSLYFAFFSLYISVFPRVSSFLYFPTCQVRVVRFYVCGPSLSLVHSFFLVFLVLLHSHRWHSLWYSLRFGIASQSCKLTWVGRVGRVGHAHSRIPGPSRSHGQSWLQKTQKTRDLVKKLGATHGELKLSSESESLPPCDKEIQKASIFACFQDLLQGNFMMSSGLWDLKLNWKGSWKSQWAWQGKELLAPAPGCFSVIQSDRAGPYSDTAPSRP